MASKRDIIIGVNSLSSDNLVSSAINAATVAAGPWDWFGSPSLPSLPRFPFCFHHGSNISSSSFFLFLSFYFEGFQSHLSWNTREFLFKCSAPEQNWPNKLRIYAFVQHLDFFYYLSDIQFSKKFTRHSVHFWVMIITTKELSESLEAIAESDFDSQVLCKSPRCVDNSIAYALAPFVL